MRVQCFLLVAIIAIGAHGREADRVPKLPGWDAALPSKLYAGYMDAGSSIEAGIEHKMFEHYVFFESERDPVRGAAVHGAWMPPRWCVARSACMVLGAGERPRAGLDEWWARRIVDVRAIRRARVRNRSQ